MTPLNILRTSWVDVSLNSGVTRDIYSACMPIVGSLYSACMLSGITRDFYPSCMLSGITRDYIEGRGPTSWVEVSCDPTGYLVRMQAEKSYVGLVTPLNIPVE